MRTKRSQAIIAHKVGMHWNSDQQRVIDGRPATLLAHAQQCLERLGVDYVDVMYLHSPDPSIPIEESAGAIQEICKRGWARFAGVSNVGLDHAIRFAKECPVVAIQPYFNMFQQDAVADLRPFADSNNVSLVCYWVLMKGLLSGHLQRDHLFDPLDRRLAYPVFRGEAWQRAQDLLDQLRTMALDLRCSVAQLVTAWSLRQPYVSVALVGAKRPEQIIESALAMRIDLNEALMGQIDAWISAHRQ